jgi:hypothetical protein
MALPCMNSNSPSFIHSFIPTFYLFSIDLYSYNQDVEMVLKIHVKIVLKIHIQNCMSPLFATIG